jgi:hypothetical protein
MRRFDCRIGMAACASDASTRNRMCGSWVRKTALHQPPAASRVKAETDGVVISTERMVWRAHCQHRITAMSESGNGQKLPVQRLQNATDDFRFPGTNAAVRH